MSYDTKQMWMAEKVALTPLTELKPYAHNNRSHSAASIGKLKDAIATFGFVVPVLTTTAGDVIAGHGRIAAAKALGLASVPVVIVDHLSPAEVRALRIADNKLAELSDWNEEALQIELGDLMDLSLAGALDFDLDITGFDVAEIDIIIAGADDPVDSETLPPTDPDAPVVTQPGDLWQLGDHLILCGDALLAENFSTLLGDDVPGMVFTDPPYNVAVNGHVRSGSAGHSEFAMASGEMSDAQFRGFLGDFLKHLHGRLPKGGIAMVCMDWRHIEELIAVGKATGFDLINLCVWNKTNGGMGGLYRSKHELIAVFKKPGATHTNNVALGKHGRNRTNVWDYAGVNAFGAGRNADLADHPTVKPTAMVADAIMDVSHRGDIVLDCFGGSGATLLAAERTGRRARLIELEPSYVDVTIRRWEALSGSDAVLIGSGETFAMRKRAFCESKEMNHV
jgi:DNA modification methylase